MDASEIVKNGEVLETREIAVAGMGCDNCARKLERALLTKAGVKEARVDRISGRATVTFDSASTNISQLQEIVVQSGYRATVVDS